MTDIPLFTIGFTRTSAERFFARLADAGVRRVLDIRLSNVSQMAGFAKRDDLRFFLRAISGIDYEHRPDLAPTAELLDSYRRKRLAWDDFEREFSRLLHERGVAKTLDHNQLDHACLLCSEPGPERCHRRLVAEHLRDSLGNIAICHL